MNEYISREDILDIASQYCPDDDGSCSKADRDIRDMLDEIEAIPAADVQPVKRGRWRMHSDYPDRIICSHCNLMCDAYFCERDAMKYCPYCGARMDGDN